jgi:hypothetical protein
MNTFDFIDVLVLFSAAAVVWLIGWGRHLCDKSLVKHVLGAVIIFVCWIIIVLGIYVSLAIFGIRQMQFAD